MDPTRDIAFLKQITRSIPDYPEPGIVFRDLSTVFQDRKAFGIAVQLLSNAVSEAFSDPATVKFAGIEARGFILAGALAGLLEGSVVMMRKPGKLPFKSIQRQYMLEYGTDALEVHTDSIQPGDPVVIVDDLLATGGTAEAACLLTEELGGVVKQVLFLVELPDLGGRGKLSRYPVHSIFTFEGS